MKKKKTFCVSFNGERNIEIFKNVFFLSENACIAAIFFFFRRKKKFVSECLILFIPKKKQIILSFFFFALDFTMLS